MAHEAGRGRAVDDPVVVGQAKRQHEPRLKGLAVPDRGHFRTHDPEDRHFWRVDDRGEGCPSNASQRRDGEGGALHFGGRKLARARLFGQSAEFAGQLDDAFLVDILDHGDHEAVRRVDGDADVPVFPQNQGGAVRT